jgi:Domain of unknown function (DUF4062)
VGDVGTVFVSHSTDMAGYPSPRSFVQAACEAVLTAGGWPVEMAYFAAGEGEPAEYCCAQVRQCDVYLGVIGFGYGSLVPDGGGISYTELEFREATAAGLPRLVFLLDPDAPVPRRLVDVDGRSVEAFRRRLRDAGVIVRMFTDAGDLGGAVLHALSQLKAKPPAAGAGRPASPSSRRPWMVPAPTGPLVERPELAAALVAGLTAAGAAAVGLTAGLEGTGGTARWSPPRETTRPCGCGTARPAAWCAPCTGTRASQTTDTCLVGPGRSPVTTITATDLKAEISPRDLS